MPDNGEHTPTDQLTNSNPSNIPSVENIPAANILNEGYGSTTTHTESEAGPMASGASVETIPDVGKLAYEATPQKPEVGQLATTDMSSKSEYSTPFGSTNGQVQGENLASTAINSTGTGDNLISHTDDSEQLVPIQTESEQQTPDHLQDAGQSAYDEITETANEDQPEKNVEPTELQKQERAIMLGLLDTYPKAFDKVTDPNDGSKVEYLILKEYGTIISPVGIIRLAKGWRKDPKTGREDISSILGIKTDNGDQSDETTTALVPSEDGRTVAPTEVTYSREHFQNMDNSEIYELQKHIEEVDTKYRELKQSSDDIYTKLKLKNSIS
jgi:hypothetical protein